MYLSCRAISKNFKRSFVLWLFNTNTCDLERSAGITSNEGFSVVAPIKVIIPFSTAERSASC